MTTIYHATPTPAIDAGPRAVFVAQPEDLAHAPSTMTPPMRPLALVFSACLVLWILLSGHLDALDLGMAVVASALVAFANRDIEGVSELLRWTPRLLAYLPWLLKEIWIANIQVVRLILDPALPIDPVIVRLRTRFASDFARTTLANSITLTPGTITLDVEGEHFVVHAITAGGGADIVAGGMARRVGRVFGDPGA
jgi:multicomponent Na+:H+ antiporter subunit E